MKFALPTDHDVSAMRALREDILASPVAVALERARTYTRVFQENEGAPWIVKKALAFREHLRTVPLFVREHDRIVGSICEIPGGMPVMAEIGIGENGIFVSEDAHRAGYLAGQVPQDIVDYWEDRNLWGRYRAYMRTVAGKPQQRTEVTQYKFLSCQGHLSPSYRELLQVGLGGIIERVRKRREGETDPQSLEFLAAAEQCLLGVSEWAKRYGEMLAGEADGAEDLQEMARIAHKVALDPPETFREAMQLIWFVHQAIHIEGHGYSNTPDRLDQILYPFYLADKEAGRLDDDEALTLCENLILKMRDNTVWSVQHNLTQGVCVAGSTPEGEDQTNELSWLLVAAANNMSVPEPLVWIRWHPNIDQDFFDYCLETLAGSTCFPLMMSDTAVPYMFMELGVSREDAFNFVPAGCNELAIPGQAYFNPCANVGYLNALEHAMTQGRGYDGERAADASIPPPSELRGFDDLVAVVGRIMRRQVAGSYANGMTILSAQMRWGQTPLTSCFFDGCIERGRDMIEGTKYNILSCGGIAFANMVDCLAALREVVYEKHEATLEDVSRACRANFEGHESLRARLLGAPKHGNDDERLREIVRLVERLRDEPLKELCRDPRDGTPFGNCHVVRSGAVKQGAVTPATPDGRLAGTPIAGSVAASAGCEKSGPTALLNSILALDPLKSWQCGYNVNMRLMAKMLTDTENRGKVRAMLNSYFERGGQEMQINCVDTEALRAAQANPEQHGDLVVRVAGFSEFFTKLDPRIQEDVIVRTEHE
ncbi:MAG: pyruvate formate lyase family protein [Armatimonadota bacterium]